MRQSSCLEDKLSKIPTTLLGRGSKILGIASKVALKELGSKIRVFEDEKEKLLGRIELAQEVVKTLSELKGASMKVGQLLSLDLGDYLPPEIVKVLEKLHHDSTFLPYPDIEKILINELGDRFRDLEAISREPIAAASIGQVHRARLHGKDIVIKVQYPGVAESIPSDLKMLEILVGKLLLIQRKSNLDMSALLSEVKEVMLKEADYHHERDMHLLYRNKFSSSAYYVPEIYPEYTTKRVLVQEYIEGRTFGRWLESNPPFEERKIIADLILKLYLEELFVAGLVQTDPNPGNFIITPDNRIALLDFGATKTYQEEFVKGYRSVIIHSYYRRTDLLMEEALKLGLIDSRESEDVKEVFLTMMDYLVDPFRKTTPFDFGNKEFFEQSRDYAMKLSQLSKFTPPPKDLVFLHRKLGGIFSFLKKLNVELRLSDYWPEVDKRV